jgi:NAD(P)-dependent dehydrogenase (short-subunit alcohol dehydrogenase family)
LLTGCDSPEEAAAEGLPPPCGLVLQYNKEEKSVRDLAEQIVSSGGRAEALCADLGQYRDAERLTEEIIKAHRTIDILVNTFAYHSKIPFRELTAEQWNNSLQQNLFSVYHISRSVSKHMTEQGKAFVNITSHPFFGVGGGVDFPPRRRPSTESPHRQGTDSKGSVSTPLRLPQICL